MAKVVAVLCIAGAVVCAGYDMLVRHVPLMSWKPDVFTIAGFILLITGLIVAVKIKPKGQE